MRERATIAVAMSAMIGSALGIGKAAPMGLVPSRPSVPPVGAIAGMRIGEGKADQPMFGGTVGVIAGGAEMARVADRDRAQAVALGKIDGEVGGALAGDQAEAVIGIDNRAAGHRLTVLKFGLALIVLSSSPRV